MLETQIENMKAQITGRDYILLKAYEDNENNIKNLEIAIGITKAEITKIENRLHQLNISKQVRSPTRNMKHLGN